MARTRSKNKRSANAPIIPESVYSENSLPSEQSQPENNNESENHVILPPPEVEEEQQQSLFTEEESTSDLNGIRFLV